MDQLLLFGGAAERQTGPTAAAAWLGFSLDHDPALAQAAFVDRYGLPPAELRRVPGALLVGPVPVADVHFGRCDCATVV